MEKKAKLKIAVLTEIINFHSGARAPLEVARHLKRRGFEVTVYAYDLLLNHRTYQDLEKSGLKITILPAPKFKFRVIFNLYKILQHDQNRMVIFSGTLPFFIAVWLSGTPVIRMYQGTQFDAFLERFLPDHNVSILKNFMNNITNKIIYLFEWIPFRLSSYVVAVSKYAAYDGQRIFHRQVESFIYNGTTKSNFTKTRKKNQNLTELLSVSRLTPYKGFHLLIAALKNVSGKFRLTIAGSQPQLKYVNFLKKISKKNVRIIINPSERKLACLYNQCDIYATCDKYLFFGMPVTEAAVFGKPAVALNYAAARELIDQGKTGYVADNLTQMTYYIQKLINQPDLRKRMGVAAKKRVLKIFTWEKNARDYENLINKLIK